MLVGFGNPSSELLTRWYQAGIWYPFSEPMHTLIQEEESHGWQASHTHSILEMQLD